MKYLFSTLLIACVSVLMSAQPKLNLNTGSIDFEWQQEEDGWHISCIKIDGKQIPAPKGYYTVLYIDRNPARIWSIRILRERILRSIRQKQKCFPMVL